MCGLCGELRRAGPADVEAVARMTATMVRRGPDDHGLWASGGAALGHRRLCIIDLSRAGSQPLIDQQLGLTVVFNGCIYNHRDLRKELTASGHHFVTDHSDTEVLIHGWREWGHGILDRFEGMFAAAIWDRARAELTLLRDRFGEKPLYTLKRPSDKAVTIAWASSYAGLLQLHRALQLSGPSISAPWLRGWVEFGWNQVPPHEQFGELLLGSARDCVAYASGVGGHDIRGLSGSVLHPRHDPIDADAFDTLLRRAVHDRLEADVPLGCFLSGGIDSALIARYASEVRPDLAAFTVRMPSLEFDESAGAAATAGSLGIRHQVLGCAPQPAEDLVGLITQLGLPFGDSSLLPATWVSRAARSHVKVALGGEGGDELFLGYERHAAAPWLVRAARMPRDTLHDFAEALQGPGSPKGKRAKLARFFSAAAGQGYKDLVAIFPGELAARLWPGPVSGIQHFGMVPAGSHWKTIEVLDLSRRFDLMFSLPLDLLRKADTASMSAPLELRSPMLDSRVADAAINASRSSLMPRGQRKGLLRQVAARYFPPEIVSRPKQGFAIPIGDWFRTDYGSMRTLLLDHLNSTEPWGSPSLGIDLNMKFVRQMLDEHMNKKRDHSQRLYMLLVLSIWAKSL